MNIEEQRPWTARMRSARPRTTPTWVDWIRSNESRQWQVLRGTIFAAVMARVCAHQDECWRRYRCPGQSTKMSDGMLSIISVQLSPKIWQFNIRQERPGDRRTHRRNSQTRQIDQASIPFHLSRNLSLGGYVRCTEVSYNLQS